MTFRDPSPTETDPTWTKPGPGSWTLDRDHTGPTPSRPVRDLFADAAEAGMAQAFDLLGGPLATMQIRFVNGRFYRRLVPAVGGDRDAAAPPALALWLGMRLHPRMRARERITRHMLEHRTWVDELTRWEREWRPEIEARNLTLTAVDVAALEDDALGAHLTEAWDHLRRTTTLHFRLHGTDVGPIGLLLARTDALGVDRGLVFDALAGASPATNAPAAAIGALRREIAAAAVVGGRSPSTLADVRALGPALADAVDDVVHRYGWRITTGYDVTDRALLELPGVLEAAVTADVAPIPDDGVQADAEHRGRVARGRLLEDVPDAERPAIERALDDAREGYGLRDENGPLTYEWPAGVLRRALLEAGRRLGGRRSIDAADHVFDATIAETVALLGGASLPTRTTLAERHRTRQSWATLEPPATLGPDEAIPPPWTLPRGMRLLTTATIAAMELLGSDHVDPVDATIRGTGIGTHVYTGAARVITDAVDAFDRVAAGDVLVVTSTAPTFNAVLALAGAVVVEEGGLLSHAAVMARELGFPAVIGASGAMAAIPDGAIVQVDPGSGRVTVVT